MEDYIQLDLFDTIFKAPEAPIEEELVAAPILTRSKKTIIDFNNINLEQLAYDITDAAHDINIELMESGYDIGLKESLQKMLKKDAKKYVHDIIQNERLLNRSRSRKYIINNREEIEITLFNLENSRTKPSISISVYFNSYDEKYGYYFLHYNFKENDDYVQIALNMFLNMQAKVDNYHIEKKEKE